MIDTSLVPYTWLKTWCLCHRCRRESKSLCGSQTILHKTHKTFQLNM